MERIPNAVYTKELREEAVKMITEGGLNASEVARRLIHWPSLVWGVPGCSNKAKAQVCDERPVNSMRRLLSTRAYRHYNKEIYTRFLAQNPDVSAWKRPILRLIASIPEAWLAVLFMAYVLAGRIFFPDWRTLSLFHLAGDYERFERLSRFTLSRRQVTKPIGLLSSGGIG